jgi:hypothetical protein
MSTVGIDAIVNRANLIMRTVPTMPRGDDGSYLVYPRVRYVDEGRDVAFSVLVGDCNYTPPRVHFWMLFNTTSVPDVSPMGDLIAVAHTVKFFGHMAVVDSAGAGEDSAAVFRAEIDAVIAAFAESLDLGLGCSVSHDHFRVVGAGDGPVAGVLCHVAECALPVTAYNV